MQTYEQTEIVTRNADGSEYIADGYNVITPKLNIPPAKQEQTVTLPADDFLNGLTGGDLLANEKTKEEAELLQQMIDAHLWHVYIIQRNDPMGHAEKMEAFKTRFIYNNTESKQADGSIKYHVITYMTRDGEVKPEWAPPAVRLERLRNLLASMNLSPKYKAELKAKAAYRVKENNRKRLLANGESTDGRGLEKRPEYANGDEYTLAQLHEDERDQIELLKKLEDLSTSRPWTRQETTQYLKLEEGLARTKRRIHELTPFIAPAAAQTLHDRKAQAVAAAVESTRPL